MGSSRRRRINSNQFNSTAPRFWEEEKKGGKRGRGVALRALRRELIARGQQYASHTNSRNSLPFLSLPRLFRLSPARTHARAHARTHARTRARVGIHRGRRQPRVDWSGERVDDEALDARRSIADRWQVGGRRAGRLDITKHGSVANTNFARMLSNHVCPPAAAATSTGPPAAKQPRDIRTSLKKAGAKVVSCSAVIAGARPHQVQCMDGRALPTLSSSMTVSGSPPTTTSAGSAAVVFADAAVCVSTALTSSAASAQPATPFNGKSEGRATCQARRELPKRGRGKGGTSRRGGLDVLTATATAAHRSMGMLRSPSMLVS